MAVTSVRFGEHSGSCKFVCSLVQGTTCTLGCSVDIIWVEADSKSPLTISGCKVGSNPSLLD